MKLFTKIRDTKPQRRDAWTRAMFIATLAEEEAVAEWREARWYMIRTTLIGENWSKMFVLCKDKPDEIRMWADACYWDERADIRYCSISDYQSACSKLLDLLSDNMHPHDLHALSQRMARPAWLAIWKLHNYTVGSDYMGADIDSWEWFGKNRIAIRIYDGENWIDQPDLPPERPTARAMLRKS